MLHLWQLGMVLGIMIAPEICSQTVFGLAHSLATPSSTLSAKKGMKKVQQAVVTHTCSAIIGAGGWNSPNREILKFTAVDLA